MKNNQNTGRSIFFAAVIFVIMLVYLPLSSRAEGLDLLDDEFYEDEQETGVIYDPLEPMNRFFFTVNDHMYTYFFKPVRIGYTRVVSHDLRYMFGNFFRNVSFPVRLVNNLLQGEFRDAGAVLSRFVINTTMGVWGFGDPAGREFGIDYRPADFGQTLGKWGVGEGVYFYLPGIGPSNIRDSLGVAGDLYFHPATYVFSGTFERWGYYAGAKINYMSLHPHIYEDIKKNALDPYVAIRQAYYDYRRGLIEKDQEK